MTTYARFADAGIVLPPGASGQVAMTCPHCSQQRDKKTLKCLSVHVEDGVWNCHHCAFSGGLSMPERQPYRSGRKTFRLPASRPNVAPSDALLKWFEDVRHIPRAVVQAHHITAETRHGRRAVVYPYYRHGTLVYVKYIAYEPYVDEASGTKRYRKHCSVEEHCEPILYGIDDLTGPVGYITEGENDTLAMVASGYTSTVSVPNGAPDLKSHHFTSKFDFLCGADGKLVPELASLKKIVLAGDMDAPGQKLAEELARRLGEERCWRVTWPEGCKDANDTLILYGVDRVRECVEQATRWPIEGIVHLTDLSPALDTMYDEGLPKGVSTGWVSVDPYLLLAPGEFSLWGGYPNHGKSSFMSHLMVNVARNEGWRFAVYSPESRPERFARALIECYVGKPMLDSRWHPEWERMSWYEMSAAQEWLNDHITLLLPPRGGATLEKILDLARTQIVDRGINALMIDPWAWIDKAVPRGQLLSHWVGAQLTELKDFGRHFDVHTMLVAHPQKPAERREKSGEYEGLMRPPTPYDVSDSANFYNAPDMIMCLYRKLLPGNFRTELHIQKRRHEESGKLGRVDLMYDEYSRRFYDEGTEPMRARSMVL